MADNEMSEPTDDTLDAELRSMIAEHRMDEILAGISCGDTTISAGGISLNFDSPDEDKGTE